MRRLVGIETEYGIFVEGLGASDLIAESIAVVRSHAGPSVSGWNYRGEDPRKDIRGFTVAHLANNPDDAQFDPPGSPRLTREEEHSDRVLSNGARFYNDHGHPEYATPECRTLGDLVAHDKAGEQILLSAARRRARQLGRAITLYKNNTDFHGASYGAHESYLVSRKIDTDGLIQAMLPFLATRPIYAGAGKAGVDAGAPCSGSSDVFQLSQRADYCAVEASVDTLHNRPLVNTRDEPHSTPSAYRRLHVICGDSNMNEYATALKVGATCAVLDLLELGLLPSIRLEEPVRAAHQVSQDLTLKQPLSRCGGPPLCAIDIQRAYLSECARRLTGQDKDTDWALTAWSDTLDALERDPVVLGDRIDWVAKHNMLSQFIESEGTAWDDARLQSLDLAYHDIEPENSLYSALVDSGQVRRIVTDEEVRAAVTCPPNDTRAYIRGLFVDSFGAAVRSIGWNGVVFESGGEQYCFDMNPLVEENVRALNEELAGASTLEQVVDIIRRPDRAPDTAIDV